MLLRSVPFLLLLFFITSAADAQEFKFVVWGDSQFQNPEIFEETVKETELLKPAFVMHVGDMIHGYTYDINVARRQWQRFKKQIEPLKVPFYPTPGNHDVTTKEIQPAYVETWGKDKLYYSFDYNNSHFIVLNTYLNQQFDTIPEVEMEWLKSDLEKAKDADNIFITMHSPLYLNDKYDWKEVHDLLKGYPVRAVFTGHYHSYDYRVIDGISYFCLNSSGNMKFKNHLSGFSHNIMFVSVKDSTAGYAIITDEKIYPADAVLPGEPARSSKFFETDKTIIISDPSINGIDTTVEISVPNRSGIDRDYGLVWETGDYDWNFTPWGKNIKVKAGGEEKVRFSIQGPKKNFTREQLPKLKAVAKYITAAGAETESVHHYPLFFPPSTTAVETDAEFSIDGRLEEPEWKNATGINNLYIDYQNTPAAETTSVKIMYDDEYLYVGIKGEEPNPEKLSALAYGDLPLVFGDDDFEIFFDTNRDLSTFYRLMVNPAGTELSSGPEGRYTFKYEVKTFTGDNFWSAEFKIPFIQIDAEKPGKGEIWGFNVRRHRQQAEPNQSDWSKMSTYPPYEPEHFGLLIFK